MKFYVSRTHVFINDSGKIDGYETVLTKPDSHKPTREMFRRMKALGITDLHVSEHPAGSAGDNLIARKPSAPRPAK